MSRPRAVSSGETPPIHRAPRRLGRVSVTSRLELLAPVPFLVWLLCRFATLWRARRPVLLGGGQPPSDLPGPPLAAYADAKRDAPPGEEGPPVYAATPPARRRD